MASNKDVSMLTIKLKIGDTEVEMTVEQARELKEILKALFPDIRPAPPNDMLETLRKWKEDSERQRPAPLQPPKWPHWPEPPYPWKQPIICQLDNDKTQLKLEAFSVPKE